MSEGRLGKKSLNLDFSDIAGATTQVNDLESINNVLKEPQVIEKTLSTNKHPVKKQPSFPPSGLIIAIPYPKGWKMIDLAQCTNEEFTKWAKFCYPDVSAAPERFENRSLRLKAFMQIKAYHEAIMGRKSRESIN